MLAASINQSNHNIFQVLFYKCRTQLILEIYIKICISVLSRFKSSVALHLGYQALYLPLCLGLLCHITCGGMWCSHYPCPHGWRVQYFVCVCVCVCVCVLPQNCCLNSISKQAAALNVGNLRQTVVLYKIGKFFQASMACTGYKFETKKLISHKRHLNQAMLSPRFLSTHPPLLLDMRPLTLLL